MWNTSTMLDFLNNYTFRPHWLVSFLFLTLCITFPHFGSCKGINIYIFFLQMQMDNIFSSTIVQRFIFEKHCFCYVGFSWKGETEHHFLNSLTYGPHPAKHLAICLLFPLDWGFGYWIAQIHASGKVYYPLLLTVNQRCLNSWFRQLDCDNYPMEIQRLMGSGTLFIMEVQQNSLKAQDITENCLMYGCPYVLWLSHFRNWRIRWKTLDYKLVPSTCSFLLPSVTCSVYPIKRVNMTR